MLDIGQILSRIADGQFEKIAIFINVKCLDKANLTWHIIFLHVKNYSALINFCYPLEILPNLDICCTFFMT